MSTTTLTVITVAEIVTLVAVLGLYLLAVARVLRRIVATLAEVDFGARAVERQLRACPSNLRGLNLALAEVATILPAMSDTIERKTGRTTTPAH